MEAVVHRSPHYCRSRSPLMCSFHCISSLLSFYSSVHNSFDLLPSLLVSHFLSLSVFTSSLPCLALLASSHAASLVLFFPSFISDSLSLTLPFLGCKWTVSIRSTITRRPRCFVQLFLFVWRQTWVCSVDLWTPTELQSAPNIDLIVS